MHANCLIYWLQYNQHIKASFSGTHTPNRTKYIMWHSNQYWSPAGTDGSSHAAATWFQILIFPDDENICISCHKRSEFSFLYCVMLKYSHRLLQNLDFDCNHQLVLILHTTEEPKEITPETFRLESNINLPDDRFQQRQRHNAKEPMNRKEFCIYWGQNQNSRVSSRELPQKSQTSGIFPTKQRLNFPFSSSLLITGFDCRDFSEIAPEHERGSYVKPKIPHEKLRQCDESGHIFGVRSGRGHPSIC